MGWHKVDFLGGDWIDRITKFMEIGAQLCIAAAPDKAVILSKEAPMYRGARVYVSPEASAAMQAILPAYGATAWHEPKPEDVQTIEFAIGDEWHGKIPREGDRRG